MEGRDQGGMRIDKIPSSISPVAVGTVIDCRYTTLTARGGKRALKLAISGKPKVCEIEAATFP